MAERSAGILFYRRRQGAVEVLLVHPGGPYWQNRDAGAWQIPKGLIGEGESALAAACREVAEELGIVLSGAPFALATIRQGGGKTVKAFALEQDIDTESIKSNTFELEWPPASGRIVTFPEIDDARWQPLEGAEAVMLKSQAPLLTALHRRLAGLK